MTKCKNPKKRASERKQKGTSSVMKKKQSSVKSSARTGKSVKIISTPFSRGTAREKLYTYLSEYKTLKAFIQKAKKLGVDPIRTLRFFRAGGEDWCLEENDGMMRVAKIDKVFWEHGN